MDNNIGQTNQLNLNKPKDKPNNSCVMTKSDLITRINKLKFRRIIFNIIGYFMMIPTTFNILIDTTGFVKCIISDPEILPIMLIVLSPFVFMIYKAHKYGKELIILNDELNILESEYTPPINNFDNLLNEDSCSDIIYEISDTYTLINRILNKNSEILQVLNSFLSSINNYNFNSIEVYERWLARLLRDIIKSRDALLNQNNINSHSKVYIQNTIFITDLMKHNIKLLISSSKILKVNYEYEGIMDYQSTYPSHYTSYINDINSTINRCDDITRNLKLALNNL